MGAEGNTTVLFRCYFNTLLQNKLNDKDSGAVTQNLANDLALKQYLSNIFTHTFKEHIIAQYFLMV